MGKGIVKHDGKTYIEYLGMSMQQTYPESISVIKALLLTLNVLDTINDQIWAYGKSHGDLKLDNIIQNGANIYAIDSNISSSIEDLTYITRDNNSKVHPLSRQ